MAAFDHAAGTVLGQVAVTAKSNEMPPVRPLLEVLDITGTVLTLDAVHTQTAGLDDDRRGRRRLRPDGQGQPEHSVLACKRLPWRDIPAHAGVQTARGRRTHRAIKVTTVPAWIDFHGAAQIAQIRRTVTRAGKKTVEIVDVITSVDHRAAPPDVLAAWVQGHWSTENRLHRVRDVIYDEDRSQIRTGHGPRVMAPASWPPCAPPPSARTAWPQLPTSPPHYDHARHPEKIITVMTS